MSTQEQMIFDFNDNEKEQSLYQIAAANNVPPDVAEQAVYLAQAVALVSQKERKLAPDGKNANFIYTSQEAKMIKDKIPHAFKACFSYVELNSGLQEACKRYPMYKRFIPDFILNH
jgi:hypothetical protein